MSFSGKFARVSIIVLHFANCEISSSYWVCKVVIHMKIAKQFLPKENLIRPNYIFPRYILISFIRCLLFQKKYFLYPKLRQKNAKDASQFLEEHFPLWRSKSFLFWQKMSPIRFNYNGILEKQPNPYQEISKAHLCS